MLGSIRLSCFLPSIYKIDHKASLTKSCIYLSFSWILSFFRLSRVLFIARFSVFLVFFVQGWQQGGGGRRRSFFFTPLSLSLCLCSFSSRRTCSNINNPGYKHLHACMSIHVYMCMFLKGILLLSLRSSFFCLFTSSASSSARGPTGCCSSSRF